MARQDLDALLNDLGLGSSASAKTPRQLPGAAPDHPADREHQSFSPLPPMPSNQGLDADAAHSSVDADPAVKLKPERQSGAPPGPAVREIYDPAKSGQIVACRRLQDLLIERGAANAEQVTAAERVAKQTPGVTLAEILIDQGADEEKVQAALAEAASLSFERIDLEKGLDGGFDGRLLQRLGIDFCKQHTVLPLRMQGDRAVIGATRPDDVFLIDDVRKTLKVQGVKLVIVTAYDVRGALEIVGEGIEEQADDSGLMDIIGDVTADDVEVDTTTKEEEETDLSNLAENTPVVRTVNYIIQNALKEGASDIHIEPSEKRLKVRYRIDGVLFESLNPPAKWAAAITSRLKIMANLDIAEKRIPQDGRIRCSVAGRKLDLRMSTLPVPHGEKTVLRILDTKAIHVALEDLGFEQNTLEIWTRQVTSPHGIVLVTGPTGSGKTTTLYASLRQLDKTKLNISTVEDPVEYHLDGITQTQTHDKIGMSFARALKALLRQDPDVIMLGEIRDMETSATAIQAALTGHLVLSTLHTNDAPSSITRLINIGIEPFLVGAAVNGVLAQRLVRRLCAHCKTEGPASPEFAEFVEMQGLDPAGVWQAPGCEKCRNTGYSGRVGIYELLTIDDGVRDLIARNPNVAEFRRLCLERGMVSLRQDGMVKAQRGMTSIQEVLRVTEAVV